jgi:hypothetical protein
MKILDVPQSGSIAGQTSSRNRFGQYRRTRAIPVNVNSPAQQAVRNVLSACSIAWQALTQVQRDAWTSWALAHPRVDSLGQTIILTGLQACIGVNVALATAGLATVAAPPSEDEVPPIELEVAQTTAASFEVQSVAALDGVAVFETSPPLSKGVQFNADFRVVAVDATVAVGGVIATKALMEAKWGTLVLGQKFFIRAWQIFDDGSRSAYSSTTVIIT